MIDLTELMKTTLGRIILLITLPLMAVILTFSSVSGFENRSQMLITAGVGAAMGLWAAAVLIILASRAED